MGRYPVVIGSKRSFRENDPCGQPIVLIVQLPGFGLCLEQILLLIVHRRKSIPEFLPGWLPCGWRRVIKRTFAERVCRIMRTGVFGGSFDPVHYGHLILAEQCREQAGLDRVLFVPAAFSPAKSTRPVADDKHRVEMLSLAIAGNSAFEVSTVEIDRGGKSFTFDTLYALHNENAGQELYLLIGEDSLQGFATWRQPAAICQLALPLVVRREIHGIAQGEMPNLSLLQPFMSAERLAEVQRRRINNRLIDISSTDIRDRVSNRQSIRYYLPRAVEKYIETHKLYASER